MLEATGERVIEDEYKKTLSGYVIYLMHVASYDYAEPHCDGKKVLDLGCGSGYGSERLARVTAQVQAVDVSQESISYATNNYQSSNLTFTCIDPEKSLPFAEGTFDVVISFQVIEHVEDHDLYLSEAARMLSSKGVLLLITPDRTHRLFGFQEPWNRYHLREYDMDTLQGLTRKYFQQVTTHYMTGEANVARVELNRYTLMKWITLPITHKWVPASLRVMCPNAIHYFKRQLAGTKKRLDKEPRDYGFGSEVISIGEESESSLNLVIVASHE